MVQVIDVQVGTNMNVPNEESLGDYAKAAMETETGALCIRVVGEDEGRALNFQFCAKNRPTNVLSFVSELPGSLGDIAICAPVVEAEAETQSKSIADHYAHMVVHGVLHLRGFKHGNAVQTSLMEEREIEILRSFGIADPYEIYD
ncbi:MAG: rRNA maturation RNase YbeY [Pseudomonadales bacterium]|nr:rRNA maturation RNase YbeY [Pseudomonadales bacterium]